MLGFYATYEELKQLLSNLSNTLFKKFLRYLWGIETSEHPNNTLSGIACFYATYEELKPNQFRNHLNPENPFLRYLWGIETKLHIV